MTGVLLVEDDDKVRAPGAAVSRLRRKLGDAGRLIVTVWGVGYRLEDGA